MKKKRSTTDQMRKIDTPIIMIWVNERQVTAFVDTGSSTSLMKESVIKTLGLEGKVRPSCKILHSVTNIVLKIRDEIQIQVSVYPEVSIQQKMIIVPDEYLTTDVMMGADIIGQGKFTWDYKKKKNKI